LGWRYYTDDNNPEKYSHHMMVVDKAGIDAHTLQGYLARRTHQDFLRFHVYQPHFFPLFDLPGYTLTSRTTLTWMAKEIASFNDKSITTSDIVIVPFNDHIQEDALRFLYENSKHYGESYARTNAHRQIQIAQHNKNFVILFAMRNRIIIGQLNLIIWNEGAELDDFSVLERYQNQGIGSALYHHAMHYCFQHGIKHVFLVTDPKEKAMQIYRHWGLKDVGEYEEIHYKRSKF
jgi:GNAT superfamily N-acetyltransferase